MDENAICESEVSPKEIITQMKLNIFQNYSLSKNSLINLDYLLYRPSIFSLIHKISNRIGFKSQTYFLSIYYLDILHIKHQKIDINLKLLSLACLTLSAKYVENDKNVPNLPFFVAIFNSLVEYNNIISIEELIYAEVLACKLLEYKLNYYTIYDFDSFFFGHGIIKIEQLKDLNSNNNFNDINSDVNENSLYIRKILEKIYRKSRFYLDKIVYNGNICLKYSSLIIAVAIMKQSVEDILIGENETKENEIKEIKEKASKCFKEIMKEIYKINYESLDEYQNLILENDLKNIFSKEKNKRISDYINEKNLKFIRNKKDNLNSLNNNRYQNKANKTSNRYTFIKKLDISQNIDKYNYNFRKHNDSIESEEGDLYFRKERISVPKKYINRKQNFDIVKFNSTFSNNFNHSKRNNLNSYLEQTNINKIRNVSLNYNRHPEMKGLNNYLHTYTNDFYPKTRKEINNINKINMNNMTINNSLEEPFIDNNLTLDNELNSGNVEKGRYYDKYKKLVLKKRFFNRINNIHNRLGDYSISQLNNSNTMNEKNPIQNNNKPYFKKIIKNITNFSTKQNSKVISFFSTMNNNMYNANKSKKNKIILLNQFPFNKNNNSIENELNIDNNEIKENKTNITLDNIKINEQRNLIEKKIMNKNNYIFNQRKKIYSNNILLNSMTLDDKKETKKEKEDIILTTNERQKLLFNRMKNINNKINYKNNLNNTEIKNNENSNRIPLKTKFIILNNTIKKEIVNIPRKDDIENNSNQNKDKIYENQIINKNEINKRNINKINNNIIKEINQKSLRFKYLNNKNINENKLNISKEELNIKNMNKNKRNKIMNTLDINQLNNITESKNIPNIMFNTLDNDNTNNKKEDNKNIIHGYHYRNYMKNRTKKEKETNNNKNENSKTIVINNNININFNNKIENSKIYPNKNEIMKKQVTTKMADSKELFNKIINKRNNNINNNNYPIKGTNEYNNVNRKISHNKVSSLMHRLPFYKKASEYNKNKYSKDTDK